MFSSMSKEKKVVVLVMALYIIGALLDVVYYFTSSSVSRGDILNQGTQAVLFLFFRYFIVMAILTEVNKGKNWARILFIIVGFLGAISYLMHSLIIFVNIGLGLISISVTGFYLSSAVILLVSKTAQAYFRMNNDTKTD